MHEAIRVGRLSVTFVKCAYETHNSLDLFEMTIAPGGSGLIPHMHADYDEIVFGMNGVVTWTVAGKEIMVAHGDKLSIPRGTPHFFINQQDAPARLMFLHTPGLMGPKYFRDMMKCVDAEGTPDLDCVFATMMSYGITPLMHAPSV